MEFKINFIVVVVAVIINLFLDLFGTLYFLQKYGQEKWVTVRFYQALKKYLHISEIIFRYALKRSAFCEKIAVKSQAPRERQKKE